MSQLDPRRWQRAREIFEGVCDLPPAAHPGYLERECGQDQTLRREVEALLAADRAQGSTMEKLVASAADEAISDTAVGDRIGAYKLIGHLGTGGMGQVYRAFDTRLGREVALKLLPRHLAADIERRARFRREARTVARLRHPNIVTLFSVEEADDHHFLTMELVDGEPLSQWIVASGLPISAVLDIAIPLADAVGRAHAEDIVHRDLKPDNIMMDADGRPIVLDFGLAKIHTPGDARPPDTSTALTHDGYILGTPAYMAPEQAEGQAVDPRTDVFSIGVILYEMISGRRPFQGRSVAAIIAAVLCESPPPLAEIRSDTPQRLSCIVSRCLERDPAGRHASAIELRDDLVDFRDRLQVVGSRVENAGSPIVGTVTTRFPDGDAGNRGPVTLLTHVLPTVGVMAFQNVSGDPVLSWLERGAPELLVAGLSQSPELEVIDFARVAHIEAQLASGRERGESLAGEIARRAGISVMVLGTILGTGTRLRVQARIVDVATGTVVCAHHADGSGDDDIFAIMSDLVRAIQISLEVHAVSATAGDGWLRQITTRSAEAYRLFLQAREATEAGRWDGARRLYERSIEIDPDFVSAVADLATMYWNLGDEDMTRSTLDRALVLRDRARPRDRLHIDLIQAIIEDDSQAMIDSARQLHGLFPENDLFGYIQGRGHHQAGHHATCVETLRPLVEKRFHWPWTYILYGRSLATLDRPDEAELALRLGLEVTGDNPEVALHLGLLLQDLGRAEDARKLWEAALASEALDETPRCEALLHKHLGDLLMDDEDRARSMYRRALELGALETDERIEVEDQLQRMDEAPGEPDARR